ncbi:hypothetical protein P9139_13595 [Curtobacterium flaccumfaciens]|nr:hypothetical protein P9139_13595 [Curtobacterium flaccumfaciens]
MTGQCRADGLIDPDAIPGANIKAEQVDSAGTAFSTSATDVRTRGSAVKTAWAKLGGSYTTPDSAELLTVMDGVETDTASLAATLQKVSTHLSDYATAVAPIAKRLVELKAEAETFVAKALKGKTVGPWDPEHPANQGIVGLVQNFGQQFDDAHLRWDEYTPYVDENNDLLTKVAEQETKLSAASAECVNAINGLRTDMCLAEVQAVDYTAAVKANEPMPWGSTGRGDQSCSESFSFGMDDALQGTLDGLGGLIGYNSQTGGWGDGDWAAQSWKGFAESLGLIALMGSPPLMIAGRCPRASCRTSSATPRGASWTSRRASSRASSALPRTGATTRRTLPGVPRSTSGRSSSPAPVRSEPARRSLRSARGSPCSVRTDPSFAAFGSKLATAGTAMVRVGDALGSLPGKALSGVSDLLERGGVVSRMRCGARRQDPNRQGERRARCGDAGWARVRARAAAHRGGASGAGVALVALGGGSGGRWSIESRREWWFSAPWRTDGLWHRRTIAGILGVVISVGTSRPARSASCLLRRRRAPREEPAAIDAVRHDGPVVRARYRCAGSHRPCRFDRQRHRAAARARPFLVGAAARWWRGSPSRRPRRARRCHGSWRFAIRSQSGRSARRYGEPEGLRQD